MIIKICLYCGKKYIANQNNRKYCCLKCSGLATGYKKGQHPSPKTEFKKGFIPWSKLNPDKMPKGENHPSWKGGRIKDGKGYILIYKPNHPRAIYGRYVYEHRLVAEKCLGRYLKPKEMIHHLNGIIDDNRPENLYLFPSFKDHWNFHRSRNKPELKSNLLDRLP